MAACVLREAIKRVAIWRPRRNIRLKFSARATVGESELEGMLHHLASTLRTSIQQHGLNHPRVVNDLDNLTSGSLSWAKRSFLSPYLHLCLETEIQLSHQGNHPLPDRHPFSPLSLASLAPLLAAKGLISYPNAHLTLQALHSSTSREILENSARERGGEALLIVSRLLNKIKERVGKAVREGGEVYVVDGLVGENSILTALSSYGEENLSHFHSGEMDVTGRSFQSLRGDRILWIDGHQGEPPLVAAFVQILRETVGEAIAEGFPDAKIAGRLNACADAMYAIYPPGGSGFVKHLDYSGGEDLRCMSAVYYLSSIDPKHGGSLLLYPKNSKQITISPKKDRLVLFWSREVEHEVLPLKESSPEFREAISYWYLKEP
ncbi:hypothetical protein AAMO2058_000326600 [Amorphochlora amoebiformis]